MISDHIRAAIAAERRTTLMADAAAARQARQARLFRRRSVPRPAAPVSGRLAVLRDGTQVRIRQVEGADTALLADVFDRLSPQSRRLRFLIVKHALSAAELRYLTDIDHHDHEALVAVDPRDGRGVGVARYVRDSDDARAAELAVTVLDDWQGRGLGPVLLDELTERARAAGIGQFTALVAADNVAAIRSVQSRNSDVSLEYDPESHSVQYEIPLGVG